MYQAISASARAASISRSGVVRLVRRRLVTESAQSQSVPKKKKNVLRNVFLSSLGLTGIFYVGSSFAAFYNQPYYDFFSDHVPLGQPMLELAESQGWDTLTVGEVLHRGGKLFHLSIEFVTDTINGIKGTREPVSQIKQIPEKKVQDSEAVGTVNTNKLKVNPPNVVEPRSPLDSPPVQLSGELAELVRKVQDSLNGKYELPEVSEQFSSPQTVTSHAVEKDTKQYKNDSVRIQNTGNVYGIPLPIGFEPPPGFSRPPSMNAIPSASTTSAIPRITPPASSLDVSEPTISHLARIIDELASFAASNPSTTSEVFEVVEAAKSDLTSLSKRVEEAREEERLILESKLDDQVREYTLKMMEMEMAAQDKIDDQHEDFRQLLDEERLILAQGYREKLDNELRTQTDIINERLKQEVIAQGIELQRRWIREIKLRVEQERGGRLGKLEELASQLKHLERIMHDNSNYLDDNIRAHNLWSAVRALTSSALISPVRKPFREELRVLRHVAATRDDPVFIAALDSLDSSETPDIGVEPFADLATWFATDVAPKLCQVSLVPEEDAGILSYLASHFLSGMRFRRHGLVNGNDVLSVVSRAEYYLNEKDLDSAARELNQIRGPAKILLHDWLEAARRRLEVEQALQVLHVEATLTSLLSV